MEFNHFLNSISFLPHLLVYTPFQSCETYMLFPICHLFCGFTFEVNLLYSVQPYMSITSINSTGKIRFICIATFFIQITYILHPSELYVNIFITSRFNSSQQSSRPTPTRRAINVISPVGSMNIGRHIEIRASTISA